jgi:hypothetical protein
MAVGGGKKVVDTPARRGVEGACAGGWCPGRIIRRRLFFVRRAVVMHVCSYVSTSIRL